MNYRLYNDTLCPKLWNKQGKEWVLDKEVRKNLLQIAKDFVDEQLKENNINVKIQDIIIVGSATNYNWTQFSDIDLHVVVDFDELDMDDEQAETMFNAIKANWNKSHNIQIKGHDIEIYVQGTEQENASPSVYSVLRGKWIKPPIKEKPAFDKELIKRKHAQYKKQIDEFLVSDNEEDLRKILKKLYDMRQAGLDKKGEFSEQNIVFKILRAQGYLDKIKDKVSDLYDKEMTLSERLIKEIALNNPRLQTYGIAIKYVTELISRYVEEYGSYPEEYPLILKQIADRYGKSPQEVYRKIFNAMEALRKQKS